MLNFLLVHRGLAGLSLFFAPFLHEDLAILAGAAYIHETELPAVLVYLSLVGGVIASDIAIYCLGMAAGAMPRLRKWIIRERVQLAGNWLSHHLPVAVITCHLVPGLLFPTFVACGWFRVPIRKFATASALTAMVYVGTVLVVLVEFGAMVRQAVNVWVWAALALAVLGFTIFGGSRPKWSALSVVASKLQVLRKHAVERWRRNIDRVTHLGMPAIGRIRHAASLAEHLPALVFYFPLFIQWLVLSLRYRSLTVPTASNPTIASGGFWGESKSACMRMVRQDQQKWFADFITIERTANPASVDCDKAAAALRAAGIGFPLVVKPDIGWQGHGVRLLKTADELATYVEGFPRSETIILQRLLPYDGEAGVFYVRMPGADHGILTSLTFRYFPYVIGDGISKVAQLIQHDPRASFKADLHLGADEYHSGPGETELSRVPAKDEVVRLSFIGSLRVGAVYRDANVYITPALTARFDEISRSIPEFYVGRFDIRFKSVERLQAGEDFGIIEINGAGSEAIHAWDPDVPIMRTYKILLAQQRLLFKIGALNRDRGFSPTSLRQFFTDYQHQRHLIDRYPRST